MMKIVEILVVVFSLTSCSTYYDTIPLSRVSEERKNVAQNFAQTIFTKCQNKDYSEIEGFNISKRFQKYIVTDSLKRNCDWIEKKFGANIGIDHLASVRTAKRPSDFLDVFSFELKSDKATKPVYLHLGLYRDKNFVELPYYFSSNENYFLAMRKKYYKKKK